MRRLEIMPSLSAAKYEDGNALHLWCAYPDDLVNEEAARSCEALLSAEEHARWQRFRSEHKRGEFLTTHALARMVLSHYRSRSPHDWRFTANAHGKPVLDPDCGLRFNLSHSPGLAVCLVVDAAVEVGVDVEAISRAAQIAEVAHKAFSTTELALLDALVQAERLDRCLSLWTLKEAYVKARGVGMGSALPLRDISFLFDEAGAVRLEVDRSLDENAARWDFRLLDHAGHRVAVAAEGTCGWDLEMWEARPADAPPKKIVPQRDAR